MSKNFKLKNQFLGHKGGINVVKYNSDGGYCFSGGLDKTIKLFNPNFDDDIHTIHTFNGHGWEVNDVCLSKDSKKMGSGGGDRSAFLWDIETCSIDRKLSGHTHKINAVAFNDDSSVFATGSYDTTVRLWDTRSRSHLPIQILEEGKDSITSIEIYGSEILVGCLDHHLRTYDIRTGTIICDALPAPVMHGTLTFDKNCLLVSSLDSTCRLIDKSNGKLLNHFDQHKNREYKLNLITNFDDSFLITGSEDHLIYVYDLFEGGLISKLNYHTKPISSVSSHPKFNQIVAGSFDGKVSIWQ